METQERYNELCRLCASYDAVKMNIFGQEGKNRQLVDKIQTCLPFHVSHYINIAFHHHHVHNSTSCNNYNRSHRHDHHRLSQILFFLLSLSRYHNRGSLVRDHSSATRADLFGSLANDCTISSFLFFFYLARFVVPEYDLS